MNSAAAEDTTAGKYLTFRLGDETYGIHILRVQEIIRLLPITRVPHTPDFIPGVVNLRGKVIPIVDLRRRFHIGHVEDTKRTCIIVLQADRRGHHIILGAIVDEVADVHLVRDDQLEPAPSFGAGVDLRFIAGLAKLDDQVVMLLDIDGLFSARELAAVAGVAGGPRQNEGIEPC